jgi:hypothetical protein
MIKAIFRFAICFTTRPVVTRHLALALAIAFLTPASLLAACGPVEQPERLRFVDAIEVNLQSSADRSDLLAMLRHHAASDGLHVDDNSEEYERLERSQPPSARLPAPFQRTIFVGAFRGSEDDDLEISIDDMGHPGRAWVIFSRGAQPALATRLRERLSAAIMRRWPDARRIPITPSGGLP